MAYSSSLSEYLAVLETRLFSEGLYEIGGKITPRQLLGYLDAVYGESGVTTDTLTTIAEGAGPYCPPRIPLLSIRLYPHSLSDVNQHSLTSTTHLVRAE